MSIEKGYAGGFDNNYDPRPFQQKEIERLEIENVRLRALSAELLAALQRLIDDVETGESTDQSIQKARVAIAKARGEA